MGDDAPVANWTKSDLVADDAEVFMWRAAHWNNWMFSIADFIPANRTIVFGAGGFQGTRPGGGEDYYVSHIKAALDTAGEFFIDRGAGKLLYMPNTTTSAPPRGNFTVTHLRALISLNGSGTGVIRDVRVEGVGLRDARATYLDPHGVPSGGDWALQRSGAVFLDHTDNFTIANCAMERNDGNAIMVSGHNTATTITANDIRWTGDSAIALWGRTDELGGNKSLFGMLADDDHPVAPQISHNLIHELGAFEKQSSHVFIAKSCGAVIHHNVFFNGPRAGINVNDGFCGGHSIYQNLIFNTCRESGDHGPFNSWDRQPFSMSPGALPVPATSEIWRNLIFADYEGTKALDHDDGSSFYDDHDNVIYLGWGQKTYKPSPGHKRAHDSLLLFSTTVLTEHGGELSPEMAEHFYNNTVVYAQQSNGPASYGGISSLAQVSSPNATLLLANNTYFVDPSIKTLTLSGYNMTQLQSVGAELGSKIVHGWPSDAWIVSSASAMLTMNSTTRRRNE